MQRKIIYIINPVAGTKDKGQLRQLIEDKTTRAGIPYRVYASVTNGDYSVLFPVIKEEQITDVVIAGGDGTINKAINSLLPCKVNFGIIPCGSGNGLANAAHIPKEPEAALQVIFHGKINTVDAFNINHRFSCMLCGLGFDAQVAHDFATQTKRGLTTYAKMTVKNFLRLKRFPFTIKLAQKTFETDACFISIANSNQFGNNFTIAPKASLNDGLLDVVIVTGKNKLSFVIQTLKQLKGWNKLSFENEIKENKGVIYFQTNQLYISNPELAPLHIDGDPAETAKEIKIEILKHCFRLIQPA